MKIGFGGGCHWCTEAVFLSLRGVSMVEQGWIAADAENKFFSEAVIVHFNPAEIDLMVLIAVHLHTHSSTARHSLRHKYLSAVYAFNNGQQKESMAALAVLQAGFTKPLVTQVLPFGAFQLSIEQEQNYYYKNPAKPFCQTFIQPKLSRLLEQFSNYADTEKIALQHVTGKLPGDPVF